MVRVGEIIDSKYEIIKELGRGGMSIVYLAMDKRLNKQWAIKEFRKDTDDASKQRALNALLYEANLMKKLDHPTLPRIVDIIDDNQMVYIIMDYIEGESLDKVLNNYGAQPQEAVIEWAKQLSDVLDYLHTRNPPVIYRDMKPANIMLKPDGSIRLIDFGIAREYKEGKDGDTETVGTRGYAAPEQCIGKGQTDARTDIYSLGVTLYHLVTGKSPNEPPFEPYPIRHWNPSLSSGLEWLIQKCMQLEPDERYQSCAEVTYVLENIEKFDAEYKKKKKSHMNMFTISLILAAVFAVSSICLFAGSAAEKQNSYDSLIENGSYIAAIDVDSKSPLAYVKLANQLNDVVGKVVAGESSGKTEPERTITTGDILTWFPSDIMAQFRTDYPADYAEIQYRLGFLIWEKYEGSNADIISMSMPYFENVIAVAVSGSVDEYAGLKDKQFNLVKVFYAVSFFQNNRDSFKENIAGEKKELSEIEKYAGIDVDVFEQSVCLSFWNTNKDLLELLNSDANMTDKLKLEALKKLSYILQENCNYFSAEVTGDEMKDLIKQFEAALNSVPDSEDDYIDGNNTINYIDAKNMIKNEINKSLIPIIEATYKIEMEMVE